MIQQFYSAAQRGGVEACASTEVTTLPADFEICEQEYLSQLALILAIRQIGMCRGNSLRQQAAVWSPFR